MNMLHRWLLASLSLVVMLIAFAHVAVSAEPKQGASAAASKPVKQKSFASAKQAMEAFAEAIKAHDVSMLRSMLGREGEAILRSGDSVEDKEARERFTNAYEQSHTLEQHDASTAWIIVGKDDWPFPIPVVKRGEAWVFDTKAGKEELLNRRIGRNELSAMQAALAYVDAQQEYYLRNPQKQKLFQYAQKFVSSPGKRDGLYFQTNADEKASPLGPLFDARRAAGVKELGIKPAPYHGYYYRILKSQGPKAAGGAYSYMVKGQMIGGHALVAYPASYGNSGIMTFIVNHDGVIYEKNLGPKTAEIAQKMTRFNPDESWTRR